MRLEDLDTTDAAEQSEREFHAERARLNRQASAAFANAMTARPAARTTILSAQRQSEVALARSIVAALGSDGYGQTLGGAR